MTTRHKSRSGAHNVDTAQGVLTILQAYDRDEPLNLTPEQHRRLMLLLSRLIQHVRYGCLVVDPMEDPELARTVALGEQIIQ
jgi:hypothetical protein